MVTLTESQIASIKCAYLDLIGSYNKHTHTNDSRHCWYDHRQTISDMLEDFSFLKELDELAVIEEDLDKNVYEV